METLNNNNKSNEENTEKANEKTPNKRIKKTSTPTVSLEDKDCYRKKLFGISTHIDKVNQNARILAEKLIEKAETQEDLDMARRLIQKVQSHDLSKYEGIEWEALHKGHDLFGIAIEQHHQTNDHHPEYFIGGINQMNDLQIMEMVCDCYARSAEQGKDLREWIKHDASKKYEFSLKSGVYKKIKKYIDLLLDDSFV